MVTLASGLSGPYDLVVASGMVYWTDQSSGRLMAVPTDGGTPVTLAQGQGNPTGLAIAGGDLYWTNQGGRADGGGTVVRQSLDGGAPRVIGTSANPDFLAVQGGTVYWTDHAASQLFAAPVDGGAQTMVASLPNCSPYGVAAGAGVVYVACYGSGTIEAVPLDGGPSVSMATGQYQPNVLALDDGSLYWTNYGGWGGALAGAVSSLAVDGGTVELLASGLPTAWGLALTATSVYWTSFDGHEVGSVSRDGGAPSVLYEQGAGSFLAIATDGAALYWIDFSGGAVLKLTLP